ncbi:hypothetical protein PVAP13_3KG029500 [Panicum virgatum]|uniref:Uncharacterized protein n=1 Tax=Panicum virgatum TaxID=38727 RepID=A0A8T0UQF3_PANVG|nr:hypothetical protein PVAP13_3KG029500 [Panicum virgatum]
MADCFPPEADDLHRRWLPREILADIGIADTEPVPDALPEAAGVEELAAQLAGILGGGSKARRHPPPPPPPPPPVAAPRHGAHVSGRCSPRSGARRGLRPVPGVLLGFAAPDKVPGVRLQVCGLEGSVVAACGGINCVGGAAVAWPFVPYPPAQWQVRNGPPYRRRSPPHPAPLLFLVFSRWCSWSDFLAKTLAVSFFLGCGTCDSGRCRCRCPAFCAIDSWV